MKGGEGYPATHPVYVAPPPVAKVMCSLCIEEYAGYPYPGKWENDDEDL